MDNILDIDTLNCPEYLKVIINRFKALDYCNCSKCHGKDFEAKVVKKLNYVNTYLMVFKCKYCKDSSFEATIQITIKNLEKLLKCYQVCRDKKEAICKILERIKIRDYKPIQNKLYEFLVEEKKYND